MGLPFENADYDEDRIGATKVTELTDISISNLLNDNILVYNSTTEKWENQVQNSTIVNVINDIGDVNITNVQNGQRLVYNSSTSKWENSTIIDNNTDNLTDLTDTNLVSIANNETLIYNTNVGKWENGNINLNYIGDVNISSVSNGEVLKYNSTTSKWENQDNTDNLNELTDVTITSSQNNHVLKYNSTAGVYKNAFVNLTELADTNITTLVNNNILIYKSQSQKWEAGNITYQETDPIFTASPANGITNTLISNWNTAYGWGDHSTQGYLTSYQESDPYFVASPANGITNTLISNWNTAYGWGNHAIQGYLTSYQESDPVFTLHTSYNITNGTGFLKNNGSGTWSYDNNTYLTSANIYQLGGLTWANVLDEEVIRKSSSTSAEGAGMKLRDAVTVAFPQNVYNKTITYFNRASPLNIQFGAIDFQNSVSGYNQRIIPYNQLLTSGTEGLYLHHTPTLNSTNVSVGINVQYPAQEFQVGTTLYVDDTTKRVGIGIQNPDENLEVDGSIQIDSANVGRLKFQLSGQSPHALAEIDAELDQTNGGQLEFYTKEDNGIVTKKMVINHLGSVNILTESGVFAIKNNSGSQQSQIYNSQFGDKDLTIDAYSNATAKGIRFLTNLNQRMRITFSGALGFGLNGSVGNPGQLLQSNGSTTTPSWTDPPNLSAYALLASPNFTGTPQINGVNIATTANLTTYTAGSNMTLNGTEFNIPQSIATTATPTFNSINFTLAGGATQYITRIGAFGITTNYLTVYNGFTNYSDDRIKSNEKLITNGTSIIKQLKPKTYDKHVNHRVPADKEDNDLTGIDYIKESGFVAQEVNTITDLKHLVSYDKSKDLYSLNYIGIIPYLVKSIQELEARIKTLESK